MEENRLNSEMADLIVRHLRKELNVGEEKMLREWLAKRPEHQGWYDEYASNYFYLRWAQEEQAINTEQAEHTIFNALKRRRTVRWCYGIAASMVLLCGLAISLLKYNADETIKPLPVAQSFIPGNIQPRLILSTGEVIGLDSVSKVIAAHDGSKVRVEGGNGISYDSLSQKLVSETVWHRIVIPRGGEYFIRLEDGSEVWLNSETEISYPVPFAGNIREISLKGEAYFKVSKEAARPFVVHSGEYYLQVYGTEFNLNTYDDENIEAVLVKGIVGFQANATSREQRLNVNQLGIANSKTGVSEIRKVDVAPYIAWKNNDLVFIDEDLESIMKKVSRWYDVNVVFEDEVAKQVRFNGNIRKYSELQQLLDIMEKVSEVRFKVMDKTIRIYRK